MTDAPTIAAGDTDLARRLAEATRRADILSAVIESISAEPALEQVLTRIIESAVTLLGAGHGTISLVVDTPQGQAVQNVAACNLVLPPPKPYPPGVGFAGTVLRERKPVRLKRYGDLGTALRSDIADHAVLGVPVWWGERIIGVFGVGAPPSHRFDEAAEETLALFGRYAAVAIENARRFEYERRRAARTAMINDIGHTITSSLDLAEVLQTTLRVLGEHLHYHTVALMLVDPNDPETLVTRARGGVYQESVRVGYRQSIHQGIAGAAARGRRRLLVNDVRADPRYIAVPGGEALVAELAIPLVAGDRLVGVLNVESEHLIGEEDAADFEIVAGQLAVAIENARLFAQTEAALQEARLMYETSRQVSVALDVDDVIRAYLEQVAIRGRYRCVVVLHELDDTGACTAQVVRGRWTPGGDITFPGDRLPARREAYDEELDAGRTVVTRDLYADPRVPDDLRRFHLARGTQPSLALIPLMVGGRRIGVVVLSRPEVQDWDDADLQPYQVTAAQLAAAIDSCAQRRLVAENSRRLAVLEERQHLARELHDSVTQSVFGASLIAESLAAVPQHAAAEWTRRVGRLLTLNRAALSELRTLVAELRPTGPAGDPVPSPLGDGPVATLVRVRRDGLVRALREHAAEMRGDGPKIEVSADGYIPQHTDHEQVLFRIAQEALNNVVKHARAATATVTLAVDDEWARLVVEDDGAGFSTATATAAGTVAGGHGLTIMRERAGALGGMVRLTSHPGAGTMVEARVPREDRQNP